MNMDSTVRAVLDGMAHAGCTVVDIQTEIDAICVIADDPTRLARWTARGDLARHIARELIEAAGGEAIRHLDDDTRLAAAAEAMTAIDRLHTESVTGC